MCAALVFGATSASAQTPASSASQSATGPIVNLWYAGASTGITHVAKTGGEFSGEAGVRVWRNLDIGVEVGWLSNVVNQNTLDSAAQIATFLQQTQGQPATSDVTAPSTFGMVNFRWVFEDLTKSIIRPYAVFGVGGARVSRNSTFTLGGADVTNSLPQYGVTLGSDLTGHSSHAAFTFGGGVLVPLGKYYADANYRLMTINTESQATNVNRFNFGFGLRF